MKINDIKINGFGNLENKEIKMKSGINLMSEKNEKGKSTFIKFISGMFYGISKNKNGKSISDYEKYTPWNAKDFSGRLEYELDDKSKFIIFRDFNKKKMQIMNEKGQDISGEYDVDKTSGSKFFYEQTKMDEELFENTLMIKQGETRLDTKQQNVLIQKITNLVSTGSDNISYQKAKEKINKKLVEEIGSERTTNRPINILNDKIKEVDEKTNTIKEYKNTLEENEKNKKRIEKEIEANTKKLEIYKSMKLKLDSIEDEREKLKVNIDMKNEQKKELEILNNQLREILKEENKISKKKNKSMFFLCLFLIIVGIMFFFINYLGKNIILIVGALIIAIGAITTIYDFIKKNMDKKKIVKSKEDLMVKINTIRETVDKLSNEIKSKEQKIDVQKQIEMENMQREYTTGILKEDSNGVLNISYDRIVMEICEKEDKISEAKINLNTVNFEKNRIEKEIKNIGDIEKERKEIDEKRKEIESLEKSIKLAQMCLEDAYEKFKENLGPNLKNNISNTVEKISSGKYNNIYLNDKNELLLELKNGQVIPVDRLSMGTIDQIYLALRFNILKETIKENMPIILDEVFAYYDDERLENVLKFLNREYKDNQIIILSCSNREKDILNKLKIEYNQIKI